MEPARQMRHQDESGYSVVVDAARTVRALVLSCGFALGKSWALDAAEENIPTLVGIFILCAVAGHLLKVNMKSIGQIVITRLQDIHKEHFRTTADGPWWGALLRRALDYFEPEKMQACACGTVISLTASFCKNCGKKTPNRICNCGCALGPHDNFCEKCGTPWFHGRCNAGGGRGGGDEGRGAGGGRGRGKRKRDKSDDVAPVASMDTPIDHAILQRLTLEEVLPRLVDAAQEHDGSRFLQMKLDEQDESVRKFIFDAAVPEVEKLAKDVFGNFVVQKLLEHGDAGQQMEVAEKLANDAVRLSCHKYACRVVQKAFQVLPPVLQTKLATELTNSVITCIENMHGNHVIQKCVQHMPADSLVWIINPINDRVEYVCTHMYGCRIVERLLEKCRSHHLEGVLNQLMAPTTIAKLARDKHGNYVVQCILEHGAVMDKQRILDSIQQNLADYCRNKISSIVVEKCFQIATMSAHAQDLHDQRRAMMEVVLVAHGGKQSLLEDIMNDKFGNYIVQSIIKYSRGLDPDHRAQLQEKLEALEPQMKETTTGKRIIATMEKEFRTAP